jgi:hypothetical protein
VLSLHIQVPPCWHWPSVSLDTCVRLVHFSLSQVFQEFFSWALTNVGFCQKLSSHFPIGHMFLFSSWKYFCWFVLYLLIFEFQSSLIYWINPLDHGVWLLSTLLHWIFWCLLEDFYLDTQEAWPGAYFHILICLVLVLGNAGLRGQLSPLGSSLCPISWDICVVLESILP